MAAALIISSESEPADVALLDVTPRAVAFRRAGALAEVLRVNHLLSTLSQRAQAA